MGQQQPTISAHPSAFPAIQRNSIVRVIGDGSQWVEMFIAAHAQYEVGSNICEDARPQSVDRWPDIQ
ncbi:hypothetical protein [Achromobacter xylosoxidans]|uniref:hypothetical protein n=1 Tax=Alcaligenes xylosoxydans xylosoxydans TaxID=85698 RepID=UPI001EEA1A1A|nr:hypothetical protein [Achromobacter xylosoxidans]